MRPCTLEACARNPWRRGLTLAVLLAACHSGRPPAPAAPPAATPAVAGDRVEERRIGGTVAAVEVEPTLRVADFVPAVAASDSGGQCVVGAADPYVPEGRRLQLVFPDVEHPARRVSVTLDAYGRPHFYSDERGPAAFLTSADPSPRGLAEALRDADARGPSTTIWLNFDRDQGLAMNRGGGRSSEGALGTAGEVFGAESLGPPRRMIEVLLARCEGPRRGA
jgi:hypothetical protein